MSLTEPIKLQCAELSRTTRKNGEQINNPIEPVRVKRKRKKKRKREDPERVSLFSKKGAIKL